jgi:hypothetical protein
MAQFPYNGAGAVRQDESRKKEKSTLDSPETVRSLKGLRGASTEDADGEKRERRGTIALDHP